MTKAAVGYLVAVTAATAFAFWFIPQLDAEGTLFFLLPIMGLTLPWSAACVLVRSDAAGLGVIAAGFVINLVIILRWPAWIRKVTA